MIKKLALPGLAFAAVLGTARSAQARAIRQVDILKDCEIVAPAIAPGTPNANWIVFRVVFEQLNACLAKKDNGGKFVVAAPAKTAAGAPAIGLYIGGSGTCSDLPFVVDYTVKQNPQGIAGIPLVAIDNSDGHMFCR